ncbi:MAG: cytochrome-c peroxidase [Pseudomonadales bacterium]
MKYILSLTAVLALALSTASYALDQGALNALKSQYQRPSQIPFPSANPYSAEKAQLGKMLFFDQRLSVNFNMSCATCHNPSLGWEDGVPGAFGGQGENLARNSPTVLNMAWGDKFFWDGRAPTLEDQARGPIESPVEMNLPMAEAVVRLAKVKGYQQAFKRVFADGITEQNIQKALATYERTVVSGTSPFDRWIAGEEGAISQQAKAGFLLFNGEAGCSQCHSGWNFSDNKFYDIGVFSDDIGREGVTGNVADKHAFKTPGLRNITQRAPYMHNGSMASLDAVLIHYLSGGDPRPSRSDKIRPVPMTPQQMSQLSAFMRSLTGEDQPVTLPILPIE